MNIISQRTGASMPTIRGIISKFSTNFKRSEIYSKVRCKRLIEIKAIAKSILKYVLTQTGWFESKDVQDHIMNSLSVTIPLHQIRKYLKQKEHLSYKKGNSRPITLNIDRVELLRNPFWIKIASRLSEIKLLINIDECSITRSTKANYSWLKTGMSCSVTNIGFKRSIILISAITTKGLTINMIKSESTTSEVFATFLRYILKLMEREGFETRDCEIIIDNCSIYRAKFKIILKTNRCEAILPSAVFTWAGAGGDLFFVAQKKVCTRM